MKSGHGTRGTTSVSSKVRHPCSSDRTSRPGLRDSSANDPIYWLSKRGRVDRTALVHALHGAGLMAEKHGEYATCRSLLERGVTIARNLDDRGALAAVLDSLGRQKFIEGRYLEARTLLEESHAILRESHNPIGLARVLSHLGFLEFLEGRIDVARATFERGLAVATAADDQHRIAEFMDNLGNTSEAQGEFEAAARSFEEAIGIWRHLGQGHWLAMALNNLGKVDVRRGQLDSARTRCWRRSVWRTGSATGGGWRTRYLRSRRSRPPRATLNAPPRSRQLRRRLSPRLAQPCRCDHKSWLRNGCLARRPPNRR